MSNEYQTFEMGKWKFLFNLSTFDVIEQMTKSNSNVIKSFSMKKDFQSWMLANFPNVPIKKSEFTRMQDYVYMLQNFSKCNNVDKA